MRALVLDIAIVVAVFAGSLALIDHGGAYPGRDGRVLDALAVVLAGCSALPLLARRRYPVAVFVVSAVSGAVLAGLDYAVDLLPGPAVALYTFAASRRRWSTRAVVTIGVLFACYVGATAIARGGLPSNAVLHLGLMWGGAWFAGDRTRLLRQHIGDLSERADRAEREAESDRRLATAEERARIARDLHDSAGHAINVIAVKAGAARLRHAGDPERSVAALGEVEQLARATAGDIDHIVGQLREDSVNGAAPAGLASVDTLVAQHRDNGVAVTVDRSGTPRSIGAIADQAAYRILQEALTNAARHGSGGARVELHFGQNGVELTVANPVRAGARRSGGGHGLIGMTERAALLGGAVETGSVDGVFRVYARIPYDGRPS